MNQAVPVFGEFRKELVRGGPATTLGKLADTFGQQGKYHELFEVRKMQVRHRLGLPLLSGNSDTETEEEEDIRRQLEDGLLDACREVGRLLLADGKIQEGWMYWKPVGDNAAVAEQLAGLPTDEENLDDLVAVTLHEGVDVERGYALVLENYGTCNAITTLETLSHHLPPAAQQGPVSQLVRHVHAELLDSVTAHIARTEGETPATSSLAELVANRDELFGEFSYHIDPSHLASSVRFARILEDESLLRLVIDLTEYGRRLHSQFQYPGEEPFVDVYLSYRWYFLALLGEDVERALEYFRQRAAAVDIRQEGALPAEVYIDLLARVGQFEKAIDATIDLLPPDVHTAGLAPSLLDLSEKAGSYQRLLELTERRGDLLGFTTALLAEQSRSQLG